jgi:small subunit ribosomal protein S16
MIVAVDVLMASYNRRLCSVSLAGWLCRVSQTVQRIIHPEAHLLAQFSKEFIMVVIRLSRGGSKGRPFFNIVVADKRERRDGRFIERLGFHNPSAAATEEGTRINTERLTYWRGVGAQVSPTVERLVKQTAAKAA